MTPIACLIHVTQAGERWDTLAWRYYGNPLDYGRIITANPALDISSSLPAGQRVFIPILPVQVVQKTLQAQELPPWKR